jgi:hypothetical protein
VIKSPRGEVYLLGDAGRVSADAAIERLKKSPLL